ncbi:oligosaccharide flippase family protein [Rhodococcus tukisamuensis]|uniref:Polysaccharide transporter, PST family n=1 Tax=Rhodococcus tukisamuensis TaxID=168276 RepID=A0A1G7AN18_9NOCA|nr:oligosaccharide flippase family protein [Rhodococcus tukisamuensis]SDE15857.1 polysaccharide transporter, PST family [Rhodococcus tukisamuensis]
MTHERAALPGVQSDPQRAGASLAHRALRAALWTGASAIVVRFSNILVMAIAARIIAPEELGVYALALAVHGFVACFAAWGVTSAIGRLDLDADRLGPTVTTVTLCSSCVVAASMALAAGPIASAFQAPEAVRPIRILAVVVVIQVMSAVPAAQIQRAFRQEVAFRANVIGFVFGSATLLPLATMIHGAEAFAWSRVAAGLAIGLTMVLSLDTRYRPGWEAQFVGPLLRFGVPAAVGSLLSQLVLNVDILIIGRAMSTADLGYYMLAFNICLWPTAALGAVMDQVVLPAFSAVRRDDGDLRSTVSRAVRTVALVACPIGGFTFAFAHPLIETVYGGKWLTAAPVLSVLAAYGVLYVLGKLFDNIMIASGKTITMFVVQATVLVVLVPILIVGVRVGGLVGVGVGHILAILLVTMPAYAVAIRRATGAGIGVILRALSRPALAAVAAAGVALVATEGLTNPLAKLAVGGLVGLVVYVAVVGPQLLQLFPGRLADKRILVLATTWPLMAAKRLRQAGVDAPPWRS